MPNNRSGANGGRHKSKTKGGQVKKTNESKTEPATPPAVSNQKSSLLSREQTDSNERTPVT